MTALGPCFYCCAETAEPLLYDDDRNLAITCRVCGARGPLRPVLHPDCVDQVAQLAAAEWNFAGSPVRAATPPLPSVTPRSASSGAGSTEAAPPDARQGDGRRAPTESAATREGRNPRTPRPAQKPSAAAGSAADGITLEHVRKRIKQLCLDKRMTLTQLGMRFKLGASLPALQNIMSPGGTARGATLSKIAVALGHIEKWDTAIDQMTVEHLPNKLRKDTGANPLPKYGAPPRCGVAP